MNLFLVVFLTSFISRVWSIGRIPFSRSYQNPIQWMRNGSTLLFYSVNMPQEPGAIDHIVMNTNSGSSEEVKLEYVSPKLTVVTLRTEQGILTYSNEHTGEEELF